MQRFSLTLFDRFALCSGSGDEIHVPTRKSRSLLAYLILNGERPATREHLAGLLWSEKSESRARHSLSQSLSELRAATATASPSPLQTTRDIVKLDTRDISVDVLRFERAIADGSTDDLNEAVGLYTGPLLCNLDGVDPAFDEWRFVRQAELEERVRQVYADLIERLDGSVSEQRRLELARRLIGLDPYDERAHHALIRIYADRGHRHRARQQFEVLRDLLARDLGVSPAPETLVLEKSLRTKADSDSADIGPDELLPSVAVLRFEDGTESDEGSRLVVGLCEDITADLSNDKGLRVTASDLGLRYRSEDADPVTVSRALSARYLVSGSIRRRDNQLSVLVRLVSGETRAQLWSSRYDIPNERLFELQDEIVTGVTMHLRGKGGLLHKSDRAHSLRLRPRKLTAYEHVLRGAMYKERFTREDNAKAIFHLQRAVSLEPAYPWAHAWLSWVHAMDVYNAWATDKAVSCELALAHARRAVALEPLLYFAHWSLAAAKVGAKDFEGAQAAYERALELSPRDADLMVQRAQFWAMAGMPQRGLADIVRAREINPVLPDWCLWCEGIVRFAARNYLDAIESLTRMSFQTEETYLYQAASRARLGEPASAKKALRAALALDKTLCCQRLRDFSRFKREADLEHFVSSLKMAGLS